MGSADLVSVSYLYIDSYKVSAESRAGERGLCVIDDDKSWSLRADARRRITLYCKTQISLQGTGSEPHGLGPSSSVENRKMLACLPGWRVAKEKIGTLLLASDMVPISQSRTVVRSR